MLTAEDLLNPPPVPVKAVPLPSRGGSVYVRSLSGLQALALGDWIKDCADDKGRVVAAQLAAFLSDADGKALLDLEKALRLVDTLNSRDIRAIITAGSDLNRLDDTGVEEAAKN